MTTDFHSHILPGIDDGSGSLAESIEMLRMEAEQGITHVVATPHFYANHDRPEEFLQKRAEARAALEAEMAVHESLPEVSVGAEVHFFSGMSESSLLPQLTIEDKMVILVEMPCAPWTAPMLQELRDIYTKQRILPIIAHIDRYGGNAWIKHILQTLEHFPVLVQANASFLLNWRTSALARRLLREDQLHLLGSDCHNLTDRPPNLGKVLQSASRKLSQDILARIGCYERLLLEGHAGAIQVSAWHSPK